MADYPNNSHNAREKKPEGSGPPDKKLEKVVSGGRIQSMDPLHHQDLPFF